MQVLAVIMARGGSKGLPGKNFRELLGRPVIEYTLQAARAAQRVDNIVVTTDDPRGGAICGQYGVTLIDRPAELATDTARVDDVLRHAVRATQEREGYTADVIVMLYGNVPVRAAGIIDRAVEHLITTGADSVQTYAPVGKYHPYWLYKLEGDRASKYMENQVHRRQELPALYAIDAAVAAVTYKSLMAAEGSGDPHAFWGKDRRGVVQEAGETVDIDSLRDFNLAEAVLRGERKGRQEEFSLLTGRRKPYVLAEAGVNHNGRVELALKLAEAAKEAGADGVKWQAFSADELVIKDAAKAAYQDSCGAKGESQYDMLKRYELDEKDFAAIGRRCGELGVDFVVTPFSVRWVEILDRLGVKAFKIGSGSLQDADLLRALGGTGKAVILSTGMAELSAVDQAIGVLRRAGCGDLALLHCVSLYPTRLEQANLRAIGTLAEHTALPAGFSDHTEEVATGAWAVAAGAEILEKHFTLDKGMEGPDHKMSLTPGQLKEYIRLARQAAEACGSGRKEPLEAEQAIKAVAGMSVVAAQFIPKGTVIKREMLTVKRPGTGIPADQLPLLINSTVVCDIQPDELLKREHIKNPKIFPAFDG